MSPLVYTGVRICKVRYAMRRRRFMYDLRGLNRGMICWKNSFLLRPLTNPSSSACLWSKRFVRLFVLVAGICPDDVRCAPIMVPDDRSIAHRFCDVSGLIGEALRCGHRGLP